MEALIAIAIYLALIVILLLYSSFSWGFVISKFYVWFIISSIPEAPNFTILQFIGFAFFLSAIMPKNHIVTIKKEFKEENELWAITFLGPWITLLCGYLIYSFY